MPSSPRHQVVVGLLLGGVLGVVLAGSTGFQWNNNGIRLAATLATATAAIRTSACLPTTGDAVCGGGIFRLSAVARRAVSKQFSAVTCCKGQGRYAGRDLKSERFDLSESGCFV